jgi:hypothetical protein
MISFMISVVPPKIDCTRLSRQSSQSWRRAADWCSRRSRPGPVWSARAAAFAGCDLGGDHAPWDRLAAWQLPGPWRSRDDDAEPAAADMICLALLIFCLVERQVRKALAPHGEKMTGLPGYRLTPAAPTGRTIFMALSDLRLIPAHDGDPAMIPKPAGVQAKLLDLLEIDISRPRWLTK